MYYSKCENYGGNLTELSSGAAIIAGERGETNCCASQYQVIRGYSLCPSHGLLSTLLLSTLLLLFLFITNVLLCGVRSDLIASWPCLVQQLNI